MVGLTWGLDLKRLLILNNTFDPILQVTALCPPRSSAAIKIATYVITQIFIYTFQSFDPIPFSISSFT